MLGIKIHKYIQKHQPKFYTSYSEIFSMVNEKFHMQKTKLSLQPYQINVTTLQWTYDVSCNCPSTVQKINSQATQHNQILHVPYNTSMCFDVQMIVTSKSAVYENF